MTTVNPGKIYLNPSEKDPIKQDAVIRQLIQVAANDRKKLSADTTFYVSTTGNDTTGDGSQAKPWLTGQNAVVQILNHYDGGGHKITLQLVGSPFSVPSGQAFVFGSTAPVGIQKLIIQGDPNNPSSYVIDGSSATTAFNIGPDATGLRMLIDGVTIQNFSSVAVNLQTNCFVDIGTVIFKNNGIAFDVEAQSSLSGRSGTWTFSGTHQQLCYVAESHFDTNNQSIVFSTDAAFSFAVLNVDTGGSVHWYNNISGTCTGSRVFINHGGAINAVASGGTSDLTFSSLPGNSNGTNNGGWYNNSQLIPAVTVASLPGASSVTTGARYMVSDGAAPTFYSVVAGSSSSIAPVFSDGTNWRWG